MVQVQIALKLRSSELAARTSRTTPGHARRRARAIRSRGAGCVLKSPARASWSWWCTWRRNAAGRSSARAAVSAGTSSHRDCFGLEAALLWTRKKAAESRASRSVVETAASLPATRTANSSALYSMRRDMKQLTAWPAIMHTHSTRRATQMQSLESRAVATRKALPSLEASPNWSSQASRW